jgi:succinyl-diaminopimelate desuccinylase
MLTEAAWQNWFMSDPRSALLEAVDGVCSEAIDFTKELIEIPTENPPGNEYPRCAEAIARKLQQIGLAAKIIEVPAPAPGVAPGYCITASHGEGERALHFHGHYDVVPRSTEGQFNPVIKGENLFGRGSSDMKSGLAAMICAVQALRRARTPLHGRIELVFVPDEETGGARGSASLSHASDFGRGSIGMLTAEPTSGAVWNANRGAVSLRIRVKGKPAHVGLSCQGVNAFERMLVIARELEKLRSEVADRETAFRIHPEAARRSILMMGGECRGGSNFNVVPGECSFTVDRRINPEEDLEAEKRRLFDLLTQLRCDGIDHDVEAIQEGLSAGVPEDHPLAQILGQNIESLTGTPPSFEMCPGLLETRFYAARGIPTMAYGPGLLSISHGPNEFVPLRNIRNCAAVYALVAAAALSKPL